LRKEINRNIETLIHYPDPEQKEIREAAAKHFSISPDNIIYGNGASEFISILPDILGINHTIIPVPSYSEYEKSSGKIKTSFLILDEETDFTLNLEELSKKIDFSTGRKLIYLGQPNNPTGKSIPISEIEKLAKKHKDAFFCIDESFADFIPGYHSIAVRTIPNIIVIRSLTKFYGIPGLRLGICLGDPGIIQKIRESQIPWSVNSLAMKVGEKLFDDHHFFENSIKTMTILRTELSRKLENISWLKPFLGEANFILIKISNPKVNIKGLYNYFAYKGIIIRLCDSFTGLDDSFFRIAVRTSHENEQLIKVLTSFSEEVLGKKKKIPSIKTYSPPYIRRKALPLMIQGTASNAGKSILTAGLCRVLYQDGYAVAPFKAQNMSNNSAVTPRGKEIGRAQALQARACNINPDVRMNPVLLKPSSDKGSQVILNGLPAGNMTVKNWKEFKQTARAVVEENYEKLASEYDVIIIEGAGSPGEVNLKKNDIVNMGMARYANAPVLIAGDIDRGGVYASFIGTMAVFEEWERNLVKGFIVNRFRGDATLLGSAHDYLFEYTGKPVLGIVPFIPDLTLPEEDSVSFKDGSYFTSTRSESEEAPEILIGIIDLPYISNFTDMDPLMMEPDVRIVLIKTIKDIEGKFDCIIIPGSKNTSSDLSWLIRNGFPEAIKNMKGNGVTIIGICGGFQMLGKQIIDPEHVELDIKSKEDSISGLGMIDIETTFYQSKQLARKEALHIPSGCKIRGYEIHHGISRLNEGKVIIESTEGLLGASSTDGKVWGTYLHGIFDTDTFRHWFIDNFRKEKGLPVSDIPPLIYDIDASLDRLAAVLRENMDISKIKSIIGLD
jgi:cobyric acid synthase CobQ/histidinol-phosphate aminotransferase